MTEKIQKYIEKYRNEVETIMRNGGHQKYEFAEPFSQCRIVFDGQTLRIEPMPTNDDQAKFILIFLHFKLLSLKGGRIEEDDVRQSTQGLNNIIYIASYNTPNEDVSAAYRMAIKTKDLERAAKWLQYRKKRKNVEQQIRAILDKHGLAQSWSYIYLGIQSHIEKELKNKRYNIPKLVARSLFLLYGYSPTQANFCQISVETNIEVIYELTKLAIYNNGLL
ncbi:hypothetical protein HS7_12070 [Sulfolobales archaeon HS-7]|nr:hypothetical protein HS7_12070 [Sulfolobales archaeon HS-7]